MAMSINTTTETYDSFIKNIIETRGQFGLRVWDYAKQVEEQINIRYSNILECCKGKRATAGGFRWGYND